MPTVIHMPTTPILIRTLVITVSLFVGHSASAQHLGKFSFDNAYMAIKNLPTPEEKIIEIDRIFAAQLRPSNETAFQIDELRLLLQDREDICLKNPTACVTPPPWSKAACETGAKSSKYLIAEAGLDTFINNVRTPDDVASAVSKIEKCSSTGTFSQLNTALRLLMRIGPKFPPDKLRPTLYKWLEAFPGAKKKIVPDMFQLINSKVPPEFKSSDQAPDFKIFLASLPITWTANADKSNGAATPTETQILDWVMTWLPYFTQIAWAGRFLDTVDSKLNLIYTGGATLADHELLRAQCANWQNSNRFERCQNRLMAFQKSYADGTDGGSLGRQLQMRFAELEIARGQSNLARQRLTKLLDDPKVKSDSSIQPWIHYFLCQVELYEGHLTEAASQINQFEAKIVGSERTASWVVFIKKLSQLGIAVQGENLAEAQKLYSELDVIARRSVSLSLLKPLADYQILLISLIDKDLDIAKQSRAKFEAMTKSVRPDFYYAAVAGKVAIQAADLGFKNYNLKPLEDLQGAKHPTVQLLKRFLAKAAPKKSAA